MTKCLVALSLLLLCNTLWLNIKLQKQEEKLQEQMKALEWIYQTYDRELHSIFIALDRHLNEKITFSCGSTEGKKQH